MRLVNAGTYPRLAVIKFRASSIFLASAAALLCTVAGFRLLGLDRDFEQYEYFYNLSDYEIRLSRFEFGFRWFAIATRNLGIDFFGFLFFVASLSIAIKVYVIRAYDHRELAPWIFYLSFYFVLIDMTAIRLGLALALVLVSLRLFYSGSRFLALICAVASLAFHIQAALPIAAFIAIGLISFYGVRYRSFLGVFLSIALSAALYLAATQVDVLKFGQIGEWAERYFEDDRGYGAAWYQPSVIMSAILLYLGRGAIRSPDPLVSSSWFVGLFGVLAYYFLSGVGVLAFRTSDSLTFFNVLWLGYAARHAKRKDRLLIYATLAAFFVFFYGFLYYSGEMPFLRFEERWLI